jgi:hypothetical protein
VLFTVTMKAAFLLGIAAGISSVASFPTSQQQPFGYQPADSGADFVTPALSVSDWLAIQTSTFVTKATKTLLGLVPSVWSDYNRLPRHPPPDLEYVTAFLSLRISS